MSVRSSRHAKNMHEQPLIARVGVCISWLCSRSCVAKNAIATRFLKDPRTSRLPPERERATGTSSPGGTSNLIEYSARAESALASGRLSMLWLLVRIMPTEGRAARAA